MHNFKLVERRNYRLSDDTLKLLNQEFDGLLEEASRARTVKDFNLYYSIMRSMQTLQEIINHVILDSKSQ
jgi:hypothetical protein